MGYQSIIDFIAGFFLRFTPPAKGQDYLFRNDDVCWDTPHEEFKVFCETFWKYGYTQLHGVTLYGKTVTPPGENGNHLGPYEDHPDLCFLSNEEIRTLSGDFSFQERADIIEFLAASPDSIALHGLYHTDYSQMSEDEQRQEISEGLRLLQALFPRKKIEYFIAPFNRTHPATRQICHELGLTLLAADGVHLEERLSKLVLRPGVWYRYHHHRFYPSSGFRCYQLSIPTLDQALGRRRAKLNV